MTEFNDILKTIQPYTLLSKERLLSLYDLSKRVCMEDIPGNFIECGVYKGGASALMATVIQRYSKQPRKVFAFDTFEGMPEPTEADKHDGTPANDTPDGAGALAAPVEINLAVICEELRVSPIVIPVKGLFCDTLPIYKQKVGEIAMLHADGDWYESTMDVLGNLYDSILPEGFVQIDDYGYWEGCRKALHEFEKIRGYKFKLNSIDETGVWLRKNETSQQ